MSVTKTLFVKILRLNPIISKIYKEPNENINICVVYIIIDGTICGKLSCSKNINVRQL